MSGMTDDDKGANGGYRPDIRLQLKPEFREPLRSDIGFFGRETELSRLIGILRHRTSATVLISGHRGSGKTALVDQALKVAKDGDPKPGKLVARLALPHMTEKEHPRDQVLRSLARALYFSIKEAAGIPDHEMDRSELLYRKTFLKDLEQHQVLESMAQSEAHLAKRDRRENTLSLSRPILLFLGLLLGVSGGLGGLWILTTIAQRHGLIWLALAAAVLVTAVAVSGFVLTRVKEEEASVVKKITGLDTRSQTGSLDLSSETLEFELRELLTDLAKKGRACVFVLDELDKLEIPERPDEAIQEHVIFRIVASLKNFFSLGDGIFIFISGESFYRKLEQDIAEGEYSLAHTVFSDRIFIHALHYAGLEALIHQLLAALPTDQLTYRKFRNYLCWRASNHVFDLLYAISDFVAYEEGTPFLLATSPGSFEGRWKRGNLPADWEVAAGLQKLIGAVYDESSRPGIREELFNQRLWRLLKHVANRLYEGGFVQLENSDYKLPELDWLGAASPTDQQDLAGAVERLLVKSERYGMARTSERQVRSEGVAPPRAGTQPQEPEEPGPLVATVRLVERPPYPPAEVGREADLTPFERTYLDLAERVQTMIANLKNLGFGLEKHEVEIQSLQDLTSSVRDTHPLETVPRSRVQSGYGSAMELAQQLIDHGIAGEINEWVEKKGADAANSLGEVEPRTGATWEESLAEFEPLKIAMDATHVAYRIIGGNNSENQILVFINPDDDQVKSLSEAYSKCLSDEKGRDRRRQRLPVIAIPISQSDADVDLPEEVVEVLEEDSRSFFQALLGAAPKKRTERRPVAGWNVLRLDPLLSALGGLQPLLDKVSYLSVQGS